MPSFCELLLRRDRKHSDWKLHKLVWDVHGSGREVSAVGSTVPPRTSLVPIYWFEPNSSAKTEKITPAAAAFRNHYAVRAVLKKDITNK